MTCSRSHILQKEFSLEKHPEGGYYRQTYQSSIGLKSPVVMSERSAVTDIYYLLVKGQMSLFHKVLHDEIWHFYEGDPLRLILFDQHEGKSEETILGNYRGKVQYKRVVPGNIYQAAIPLGEYSLVGCTVAPGFDFADFMFLRDDEVSLKRLEKSFPEFAKYV